MSTDSKLAEAAELKRLIRRVSDASYTQGIEERYDSEIKDLRNDEKVRALLREASAAIDRLAAHESEQEQAAEAEPVAFVHWPMSGAPRLVWYSNKALEDATRKECDGHQPDLLLYTRPQQPLSNEQIAEAARDAHIAFALCKHQTYEHALTRAIERIQGIGITKEPKT